MKDFARTASSDLPTHFGPFRIVHYCSAQLEGLAIVRGDPKGEGVLCRVHSECMTGEVFGSLRCDCRPQLELAMGRIARAGEGLIVYLRQEGRGIGLGNKIRAYALQDRGRDTVQANTDLGFAADERSYELAAAILKELEISSVRLMTNNPDKLSGLAAVGVSVIEQLPHWADGPSVHSEAYLETKRRRMGHIVVAGAEASADTPVLATQGSSPGKGKEAVRTPHQANQEKTS